MRTLPGQPIIVPIDFLRILAIYRASPYGSWLSTRKDGVTFSRAKLEEKFRISPDTQRRYEGLVGIEVESNVVSVRENQLEKAEAVVP